MLLSCDLRIRIMAFAVPPPRSLLMTRALPGFMQVF